MKTAIVVGAGAGGATVAKELQGAFQVTVLEAGSEFNRMQLKLETLQTVKKTGLLFDEREIQFVFPHIRIRKTPEGMVLVNGRGLGGTTTICTANALRMDHDLRAMGIDLDREFDEIYKEIPISTNHQAGWHETTRRLFEICQGMGLDPQPTPKMGNYERCAHCGRCIFGCPYGVKWDSRQFLQTAVGAGANLLTNTRVERILFEDGRATGVLARRGLRSTFYPADLIVLAAGGFGTPAILDASGIPCEPRLFVDPVLWVAGRAEGNAQCYEVEMPFVVQREDFMVSPYFDYLSYFFNREVRISAVDIVGLMIKLADSDQGSVTSAGVSKTLTSVDQLRLGEGIELCTKILGRFGVDDGSIFLGTINAGHPGGSLPLTEREATTMHDARLPENVYVADSTLIPRSLGNPPILTIIALAKRVSRICVESWSVKPVPSYSMGNLDQ
jgi:choline dehydrogenase-like flavoprotein